MSDVNILKCNVCGKHITNVKGDLFHMSAILATNMKFSDHYRLCKECFMYNNSSIPIIKCPDKLVTEFNDNSLDNFE